MAPVEGGNGEGIDQAQLQADGATHEEEDVPARLRGTAALADDADGPGHLRALGLEADEALEEAKHLSAHAPGGGHGIASAHQEVVGTVGAPLQGGGQRCRHEAQPALAAIEAWRQRELQRRALPGDSEGHGLAGVGLDIGHGRLPLSSGEAQVANAAEFVADLEAPLFGGASGHDLNDGPGFLHLGDPGLVGAHEGEQDQGGDQVRQDAAAVEEHALAVGLLEEAVGVICPGFLGIEARELDVPAQGQDGKTHQCIDYVGALRDFFGWSLIVPADANQTDRAIRAAAASIS